MDLLKLIPLDFAREVGSVPVVHGPINQPEMKFITELGHVRFIISVNLSFRFDSLSFKFVILNASKHGALFKKNHYDLEKCVMVNLKLLS